MNNDFTKQLKEWLDTPPESRNLRTGANMLFRLTGNVIMHRNLSAALQKNAEFIERELRKHYNARIQAFTHAEVEAMQKKANKIVKRIGKIDFTERGFKGGRRGDHKSLPDEIKKLYVDNLDLLQRMREVHTRLKILSESNKSGKYCPDSDRYPYLKELISLDKQYRANWLAYDSFNVATGKVEPIADEREASHYCVRLVNLNKGKYAKSPNEPLAAKIREWYHGIDNPTPKLTDELKNLGIL